MIFTGKNKEDFEKWMLKDKSDIEILDYNFDLYNLFFSLPFSMQQGVYLEYLDSVGYHVEIRYNRHWIGYNILNNIQALLYGYTGYTTRQEALTEAIKKADELINAAT